MITPDQPAETATATDESLPIESSSSRGTDKRAPVEPGTADTRRNRKRKRFWLRRLHDFVFFLVIAGLCALGIVSYRAVAAAQRATVRVNATRDVLEKVRQIPGDLSIAESAARGYAITRKQPDLAPYYRAAAAATENFKQLKRLLADSPDARPSITTVEPLVEQHLKSIKEMVDLGSKHIFRAVGQSSLSESASAVMMQIRTELRKLEEQEARTLQQRQAAVAGLQDKARLTFILTGLLACLLVGAGGMITVRAVRVRQQAESELAGLLESTPDAIVIVDKSGKICITNSQTEQLFGYPRAELIGQTMAILVPESYRSRQQKHYFEYFKNGLECGGCGTLELNALCKDGRELPVEIATKPLLTDRGLLVTSAIRDITKRKRVEEQITTLNEDLENRAAQLENANRELEAFSYSVSHDLRAPLQQMDGFARALAEDYSNQLDHDGQDYLNRVRAGCQRMAELVDALLVLARMTRAELKRTDVDLTALARSVVHDLRQRVPDRRVDFVVGDGLRANCDAQLVRAILENLLGNAWKFTTRHERARIEFGAMPQQNGERVFFVRDDGAGFDMARAQRLFSAFTRLHDQSDFSGTGIGLATVQRIVHRHGGKIWAEGAVEKGATFCWTLPDRKGAQQERNGGNGHGQPAALLQELTRN